MTIAELLFGSILALALVSIPRQTLALRAGLALVGLAGLIYVVSHHRGWGPAIACGALMVINAAQVLFAIRWAGRMALSEEEEKMVATCFPTLPRHTVRNLLDQGLWMQGKSGEVILTEGVPVTHLFYLSEGHVEVLSAGKVVATSGPGHFFGEITVLTGGPATATVRLTEACRFWCVPKDSLHRFLEIFPENRAVLEASFAGDLRDKLKLANERLVTLGANAAG